MYSRIRRTVSELKCSTSGNATLLVALGMPALIGGAGLAVDTAQWYMWKRELQFAADQAALAAAWARTDEDTQDLYVSRAEQEFAANLSVVTDFTSEPSVALEDYAGGDENSVVVSASATKRLPFSSFLTGNSATIYASAQATFADGATYSACIIATSEDEDGAIILQGNVTLAQSCGIAALSKSSKAIIANGNALDLSGGSIVSAGGIDDDLDDMDGVDVQEGIDDLFDPYADLEPPLDNTSASYECVDIYETSDNPYYTTYDTTNYKKYEYAAGTNTAPTTSSTWTEVTSYAYSTNGSESDPNYITALPSGTKSGDVVTTSTGTWSKGSETGPVTGSTKVKGSSVPTYTWTRIDSSVDGKRKYYANKGGKKTLIDTIATMGPGTYKGGFWVKCDTTMTQGIYVIDGGTLKVNSDDQLTGDGVMIVLKNGATISINGGAGINLTPMTTSQIENVYATGNDIVEGSSASTLAGMLIMEIGDGNPSSLNSSSINGNAGLTLNGTVYLPDTDLDMSGNAGVSSQCLLITASKIKFSGSMTFTSLCPDEADDPSGVVVSSGASGVKLVA